MRALHTTLISLALTGAAWAQPALEAEDTDEPALPAGLEEMEAEGDDSDEPALPAGMDDMEADEADEADDSDEPALPMGMDEEVEAEESEPLPIYWHGFLDIRHGVRTEDVDYAGRTSMQEARTQLEVGGEWEIVTFKLVGDLIYDPVLDLHDPDDLDLETGDGFVDLRQAYFTYSPADFVDLKIGRQILTWGKGDLIFINDLFPKDWTAFMIGRDIEYLKAPSDAARLSVFTDFANLDIAFTPRFDADRYPDRRRVTSWDPIVGRIAGVDQVPVESRPDEWFKDYEVAGRLTTRLGAYELALYGYHGFWKSPFGFELNDPMNPLAGGKVTFDELTVAGASFQGPMLGGILSLEGGYYHSHEDTDGDDVFVRNSDVRGLVGFEREAAQDLTISGQYYVEWIQQHDEYEQALEMMRAGMAQMLANVPPEMLPADLPDMRTEDEFRHVLTTRLRYLTHQQSMTWSLFAFYSPSDQDGHLRPNVSYKIDDLWTTTVGANLFFGKEDHTFYSQLQDNSSFYSSIRMAW